MFDITKIKPPNGKADAYEKVIQEKEADALVDSFQGVECVESSSGVGEEKCLSTERAVVKQHEQVITDQSGRVCFIIREGLHLLAVPVESKRGQSIVRQEIQNKGGRPNRNTIRELTDDVLAYAETKGPRCNVFHRVAPSDDGIEIYLGDEHHSRVRITAGKVEVITDSSDLLFCPKQNSLPMPVPAEDGSVEALRNLLNVCDEDFLLLMAWVTYTLAHPKVDGSKYVFLVLTGEQGSGKSFISKLLLKLIDPSSLGVQSMPSKPTDLALILQSQHVVAFDNMRNIKATTSDLLCMASTGGVINDRKLYTDSDISTKSLHGAVIFNGIHRFLHQSDLAQRCLNIKLERVGRRVTSEITLLKQLEQHHAEIQGYLLNVIAKVLRELEGVKVQHPERMIDFCRWLAAFEVAERLETGSLQAAYRDNLTMTQLDSLMDNVLAAAIVGFCEEHGGGYWKGTPEQLHKALSFRVDQRTQYSREWPQNSIGLGKRLVGLVAGLGRQGILVEMRRGRQRMITLHINPNEYPEKKE